MHSRSRSQSRSRSRSRSRSLSPVASAGRGEKAKSSAETLSVCIEAQSELAGISSRPHVRWSGDQEILSAVTPTSTEVYTRQALGLSADVNMILSTYGSDYAVARALSSSVEAYDDNAEGENDI